VLFVFAVDVGNNGRGAGVNRHGNGELEQGGAGGTKADVAPKSVSV
jgi:hypothetical protein